MPNPHASAHRIIPIVADGKSHSPGDNLSAVSVWRRADTARPPWNIAPELLLAVRSQCRTNPRSYVPWTEELQKNGLPGCGSTVDIQGWSAFERTRLPQVVCTCRRRRQPSVVAHENISPQLWVGVSHHAVQEGKHGTIEEADSQAPLQGSSAAGAAGSLAASSNALPASA